MPTNSPSASASHHEANVSQQEPRLLIVDDDATQRSLLSHAARLAGHAAATASSVKEAIEKLSTIDFDCVTLDLQLEDGCGIAVLEAMAAARFSGAVVVISGLDATYRKAARLCARRMGIEMQSLPKPVDLAALRVCLADLGKTAKGLPAIHSWGGIASDHVVERHRAAKNP